MLRTRSSRLIWPLVAWLCVAPAGAASAKKKAAAPEKAPAPEAVTPAASAPVATGSASTGSPAEATPAAALAAAAKSPADLLLPAEDTAPQALREKQFFYGSFGMRDPFRSLVGGDFEPAEQELVDLHTVQLVGMLWEDEEYVAIVQDAQGFGYALSPGDPVRNGVVVSVTRHELVGRLNVFGMVDRVNLRLQRERDEE
ncbi:MAG TPA: hypothetical protein VFE28_02865 [Candidatus Krumholzibacteria bacterium]|nr:hypothetical protein [Candidatus Krumholzibacteria bacterium]